MSEMRAAARRMCAECPQAQANQGRDHPDDWYSREAVAGLWRGVRSGSRVSCHVTEADRAVRASREPAWGRLLRGAPSGAARHGRGIMIKLVQTGSP